MDDEPEGDEDASVSEDEVREALLILKTEDEPDVRNVVVLATAAPGYAIELVPPAVVEALAAVFELDGDVANGGLDQFVWNHGVEISRQVAAALRAVGALENADVIDRLAGELAARADEDGDPVARFLAFRRAVKGPEFGIPGHQEEAAEAILEYVLERAESLPDADAELPRRAAQ